MVNWTVDTVRKTGMTKSWKINKVYILTPSGDGTSGQIQTKKDKLSELTVKITKLNPDM